MPLARRRLIRWKAFFIHGGWWQGTKAGIRGGLPGVHSALQRSWTGELFGRKARAVEAGAEALDPACVGWLPGGLVGFLNWLSGGAGSLIAAKGWGVDRAWRGVRISVSERSGYFL